MSLEIVLIRVMRLVFFTFWFSTEKFVAENDWASVDKSFRRINSSILKVHHPDKNHNDFSCSSIECRCYCELSASFLAAKTQWLTSFPSLRKSTRSLLFFGCCRSLIPTDGGGKALATNDIRVPSGFVSILITMWANTYACCSLAQAFIPRRAFFTSAF